MPHGNKKHRIIEIEFRDSLAYPGYVHPVFKLEGYDVPMAFARPLSATAVQYFHHPLSLTAKVAHDNIRSLVEVGLASPLP